MDYNNFHVFGSLAVLACVQTSPIPLLPREGRKQETSARRLGCIVVFGHAYYPY